MYLTAKQVELLTIIEAGNPDGSLVDLDQLIERASYRPKKDAAQFSIRCLIAKELIEKRGSENRRLRRHTILGITPLGSHFTVSHTKTRAFALSEADDALLLETENLFSDLGLPSATAIL